MFIGKWIMDSLDDERGSWKSKPVTVTLVVKNLSSHTKYYRANIWCTLI